MANELIKKKSGKPRKVTKAVFPVAGLGTRFLPATKSIPKEIMTLVDRPLIQYAIDEARAAGIKEFIFVTSRGKSALEDYFDHAPVIDDDGTIKTGYVVDSETGITLGTGGANAACARSAG